MASASLDMTLSLSGGGTYGVAADISTPIDSIRIGTGGFTSTDLILTTGTSDTPSAAGVGQANKWFHDSRTVAATTADNLDLAGSLVDLFGNTLTFTKIKFLLVSIDTPDGTKTLRIGPQAVANAFAGPWAGGLGATVYTVVDDWSVLINKKWAGYAVTAGTGDILGIYNPGAGSVTYRIWIVGVG